MRLEWIEDILAVLDAGSLIKAAEIRCRTQSAFSRRLVSIEMQLETRLFDHSSKPIQPLPHLKAAEEELRYLAAQMHYLHNMLKQHATIDQRVTIACAHTLATTYAPEMVELIRDHFDCSVHVLSADHDNVVLSLLSGKADLALFYQQPEDEKTLRHIDVCSMKIAQDRLIPVGAKPNLSEFKDRDGRLRVVAFPAMTFLGRMASQLWSNADLPVDGLRIQATSELSHTLLQMVQRKMGIAWLPESLVQSYIKKGQLNDLSKTLPTLPLDMYLFRLNKPTRPIIEEIWEINYPHSSSL